MSNELQNIPALWTALSHWVACTLYALLLPRAVGKRVFWLAQGALLVLLIFYMRFVAGLDGLVFNLLYVGFALLCALPALALNRLPLAAAVYYAARGFILGGFTASLAWQLYSYFRQRIPLFMEIWAQVLFMLAVYAAVYILMELLEGLQRRELSDMPIPALSSVSTLFIAAVIYIVSSLSFSPVSTPFGGSTYAEAFNIRTLVYFGGVAILYAHHLQLYETYMQTEVNMLHSMLDAQYANFQVSQESIDLVNRKYHDLKHQISVLRSEAGQNRTLEHLDELERDIHAYEAQNKTGNRALDIILTSKNLHCQELGISLTTVVEGSALDFMDELDLCSLFGNALDNAIESAGQLPDPEQRLIHLSVNRERGFVRILLENRCAVVPELRRGLPVTTKADRRLHGFGLKSIKATAEKYGGSMTICASDGWFELRVLLPGELSQNKARFSDSSLGPNKA